MGIYDRDYYRRSGPSIFSSFAERGHVCKWLVAINVVFFVIQLMTVQSREVPLGDPRSMNVDRHDEPDGSDEPAFSAHGHRVKEVARPFTDALILDFPKVLQGQIWRLLTYAFLHDSFWHIFWNMLLLWWFGKDVEDLYGPREFLTIYLLSAILCVV